MKNLKKQEIFNYIKEIKKKKFFSQTNKNIAKIFFFKQKIYKSTLKHCNIYKYCISFSSFEFYKRIWKNSTTKIKNNNKIFWFRIIVMLKNTFLKYKNFEFKCYKKIYKIFDKLFLPFWLIISLDNFENKKLIEKKKIIMVINYRSLFFLLNIDFFRLLFCEFYNTFSQKENVKILVQRHYIDKIQLNHIKQKYIKYLNYPFFDLDFRYNKKSNTRQNNRFDKYANYYYLNKSIFDVINTIKKENNFYFKQFKFNFEYFYKYSYIYTRSNIVYRCNNSILIPKIINFDIIYFEYACQICNDFIYKGFKSFYYHFFDNLHINKLFKMGIKIGEEYKYIGITKIDEIVKLIKIS